MTNAEQEANEIIAELKAEIERLREKVRTEKIYSSQIEELEESLNHLKQENERLKEENKKLNKMTGIFSARLCEKYRQALQEIKQVTGVYNEVIQKINKAEEE